MANVCRLPDLPDNVLRMHSLAADPECRCVQVTYPQQDGSLAAAFPRPQQAPLLRLGADAIRAMRWVLPRQMNAQLQQLLASPTQGCLAALKAAGRHRQSAEYL
jgi:aryl carrier-like protein